MKKLVIGAVIGAATAAIGYKIYKNNEDEIRAFFDEYFGTDLDVDIEDMDIEELEELREYVDEIIENKENVLEELNSEFDEKNDYITLDSSVADI